MPFLELVGNLILWVILLGLLGVVLYAAAGAFMVIFFGTLLLGWIPILMCASDPEMFIRWHGTSGFWGFFEQWAYLAMVEYWATTAIIIFLAVFRPDPDGLPPALKVFALFYVTPAAQAVQARDAEAFIRTTHETPKTRYESIIETKQLKKEAENLEREKERRRTQAEVAKAMIELKEVKAREEALKGFIKRHDK